MRRLNPIVPYISLEHEVHQLEERLIAQALIAADGSLLEASRLLQLRSEQALKFILRRHPQLRFTAVESLGPSGPVGKVMNIQEWKALRPQ